MSSSSRTAIFERIEAATASLKTQIPLPDYDVRITHSAPKLEGGDPWEVFSRNFKAVNGKPMDSPAELADFLKATQQLHGYCDPALIGVLGPALTAAGLTVETVYDRRYDDYQFWHHRATGAIAESGTLIIDDERTSHRLAALSPWVRWAVLERGKIHRCISDAIAALATARTSLVHLALQDGGCRGHPHRRGAPPGRADRAAGLSLIC